MAGRSNSVVAAQRRQTLPHVEAIDDASSQSRLSDSADEAWKDGTAGHGSAILHYLVDNRNKPNHLREGI